MRKQLMLCFIVFIQLNIIFAQSSIAQIPQRPNRIDSEGLRQGEWTILYDAKWKETKNPNQVEYYRMIEYQDDKPVGKVYDYYKNGQIQMEATLLADRPESIYEGEAIWYRENGSTEVLRRYENGKKVEELYYNEAGEIIKQPKSEIDIALEHYDNQEYTKALSILEKYREVLEEGLKDEPEQLKKFYFVLATCYKETGRQKEYKALIPYIQPQEDSLQALNQAGMQAYQSGDYQSYAQEENWESLIGKGNLSLTSRDYDNSRVYLEKAKIQADKEFGKEHKNYAITCNVLAQLSFAQGHLSDAKARLLEARESLLKAKITNDTTYAQVLSNLAYIYLKEDNYKDSEALLLQAREILINVVGKEHTGYASCVGKLGSLYYNTDEYKKAELFYIEAKDTWFKNRGRESMGYAMSCNNLGALYLKEGLYEKADTVFQEANDVFAVALGKEHPVYATSLNNLAELYRQLGRFSKSETLHLEAIKILAKTIGKNHPEYATSLNNLALLYQAKSQYSKSESLLLESKEIRKVQLGLAHVDYAESCNNLAVLYKAMGRFTEAEELYWEALKNMGKVLGKEHTKYAILCSNLAGLFMENKSYSKADSLYQIALKIINSKFKNKHYLSSSIKIGLALLKKKQGIYSEAEEFLNQSIKADKINFGEYYPELAYSYNNLASLSEAQEKFKEAEQAFLNSLNIYEVSGNIKSVDYAITCGNLASLLQAQGFYDKAFKFFKKSSHTFINQINNNFINLSEKERRIFFNSLNHYFEIYNSFTLKAHHQFPNLTSWLYNNNLMLKGLLFQSTQKIRNQVLASDDTTLIQLFHTWQDQREYLGYVYTLSKPEKQKQGIDQKELEAKVNTLEKELSTKSQAYAQLTDNTRYTWQDIQARLQPGEAAIELIRTRYYDKKWTDSVLYIALIVKPETKAQPEMLVLPNGNELEGKHLKNYKKLIEGKKSTQSLYQPYWQAIKEKLKGVQKVYLSPDGVFHQINLGTLMNPETRQYVMDETNIHLLGSTQDLVQKQIYQPQAQSSVIIGDPRYYLDIKSHQNQVAKYRGIADDPDFYLLRDALVNTDFYALPKTKAETASIYKMLKNSDPQVQLYQDSLALEEVVKKVQNPRVLHIATHGKFFESTKEDTPSVMKNFSDLDDAREILKVRNNPMMRSGLAFAGVLKYARNKEAYDPELPIEDGFLTAFEAQNLNLDGTELVVLSACETGLGDVQNGEGVYGLQRGFQAAGAKAVLMSLWTVDDGSTQELMTIFYQKWLNGQSKRDAFQAAQQSLRAKYKSPYHWGAFVLIGN